MQWENVWIRLAANNEAWHGAVPHELRWRIFVDPSVTMIPVREVRASGTATERNLLTRTLPSRDERGVVAWVHYFGNLRIENGIAHITLKEPTPSPSQ